MCWWHPQRGAVWCGYFWEHGDPRLQGVRSVVAGSDRWLDGLWHGVPDDAEEIAGRNRRYMEGAAVDGVPLQVVELSGGPGDLYVMHVDCFHTSPRTAR